MIPQDALLIAFNTQFHVYAERVRNKSSRVLIWDIFPPSWGAFLPCPFPFVASWFKRTGVMNRSRRKMARIIADKQGVVFMEEAGLALYENLSGLAMQRNLVVPVHVKVLPEPQIPRRRLLASGPITAVYLGRSDAWKAAAARKAIRDFARYENVHWTIVTDSVARFKSQLNLAGDVAGRLEFVSGLQGDDLQRFLLSAVDICFAMGTACLEGARLGIPSILLDFSPTDPELPSKYGYRWLYEEPGTSLGRDVTGLEVVQGMSPGHVLAELVNDPDQIGRKCWATVEDRFSTSSAVDRLELACGESRLRLSDFSGNLAFTIAQCFRAYARFRRKPAGPEMLFRDFEEPPELARSTANGS
jgi:hypothetical protein